MPPSLTFKCKTITPMLMHGADGASAELRPASIKGVLRFWWRAIYGNLKTINELHDEESKIFGSTDKRSKVIIFPIEITKTEDFQISPTPHHRQGYCSEDDKSKNCFFRNNECQKANEKDAKLYTFTLKMMIQENKYMNDKQLKNLFILATTLGGFGQRSRRGFGSVKITNITINGSGASASPKADENKPLFPKTFKDIEELINQTPKFQNLNKHKDDEYPYIQEIKVGKIYDNFEALLTTIGTASHAHDCNELGSANPRLASPIYVSVIQDGSHFRPVITTLKNTKSDNNNEKVTLFKGAING
ncbi:MAG: type III-B CRISPR module RAMP protein Cmr1 [Sulfuricurvum sp.]